MQDKVGEASHRGSERFREIALHTSPDPRKEFRCIGQWSRRLNGEKDRAESKSVRFRRLANTVLDAAPAFCRREVCLNVVPSGAASVNSVQSNSSADNVLRPWKLTQMCRGEDFVLSLVD